MRKLTRPHHTGVTGGVVPGLHLHHGRVSRLPDPPEGCCCCSPGWARAAAAVAARVVAAAAAVVAAAAEMARMVTARATCTRYRWCNPCSGREAGTGMCLLSGCYKLHSIDEYMLQLLRDCATEGVTLKVPARERGSTAGDEWERGKGCGGVAHREEGGAGEMCQHYLPSPPSPPSRPHAPRGRAAAERGGLTCSTAR